MNEMGIIKNLTILDQIPLSDSSFINYSFSTCDQVVVEFQVGHDENNGKYLAVQ